MTHPDILKMERFGELDPMDSSIPMGKCVYCGEYLYHNQTELTESIDGFFCDLDCCHKYYEIQSL